MAVLLETSIGDIVVDLYVEERPKCAINFLKLCKAKYYNYSLFYSLQRNFIAQTGDPLGTGQGGQSVWGLLKGEEFKYFETETVPRLKHIKTGTLSMVNDGGGRHGSQFFLTLSENLSSLDGMHTVFGELAEGMEVLEKMNEIYCDKNGRPFQDIRIYHTVILEDPFDDLEGLEIPDRSPSPPKVITDSNRIGAEEDIEDYKGLTENQIRELVEQREAKANAQVLEMVGDIPDADAKPPENVVFVCKLNPVTTDEDLEIIFSRFGPIVSCEVIRDQKTGDSLQYAFIEFENEEDCTKAYFKMDNVLIDDRRIHVDFSQSLAKVKGITRRKYSEEESAIKGKERNRKGDDRLVARKKTAQDGGGYQMVFNDEEEDVTSREQATMSDRQEQRDYKVRDNRGKREKERVKEKHERRVKEKEKDSRHHSHRQPRSHDRKHMRSRSRSHERKHKRSRSRSHDRKHRSRSRSRSRERKVHNRKSHDRHKRRDRSRSRERFHRK